MEGLLGDSDAIELLIVLVFPTSSRISSYYPQIHINTPHLDTGITSLVGKLRLGHIVLNTTKSVTVDVCLVFSPPAM
jgi:hypothetical protein